MNIRTKVITTIIAMICSLSVSATGIAAIMLEFPIQVANGTSLTLGEVQGNLWGIRKGANNYDFDEEHMLPLFKKGSELWEQQEERNLFCQDVSFSNYSTQIEYIMIFVLAEDATNGVMITLKEGSLSNHAMYTDSYKYVLGNSTEMPDWETAKDMETGKNIVVTNENRVLFLRASLSVIEGTVSRVSTGATWSFSYNFAGISVEDA